MKNKLNSRGVLDSLVRITGSSGFLAFVIGFFILEATWVAISFRFPLLFDEHYHVGVIGIFSQHLSPLIFKQPNSFDVYGNIAFSNASLYHYIMGFAFSLAKLITNNFIFQVVFLRLINVIMAASGLYIYVLVLREIKISRHIANLAIFLFSLTPLFIYLSASVSYDNMLFVLTAYFFLVGARIVQSPGSFNTHNLLKFIIIGLLASLVKFSFLPVFIVGIIYVAITIKKNHAYDLYIKIKNDFNSRSKIASKALLFIAVILLALFAVRYAYPSLKYKTPLPDCSKILNVERCEKSSVYFASKKLIDSKNNRTPQPVNDYAVWWLTAMAGSFDASAANTGNAIEFGRRLPLASTLISASIFVGITVLIYMWNTIKKTPGWRFLVTLAVVLMLTLFMFNAVSYYSANTDLNTQTRYSMSIIPVVMGMAAFALNDLIGRRHNAKLFILLVILLLCLQGMGDIKHIVGSNSRWYMHRNFIIQTNSRIRNALDPMIIKDPRL